MSLTKMNVTLESWIEKTLQLLKLEYEADVEQNSIYLQKYSLKELENNGLAIRKLVITNQRSVFNRQYFHFSVPQEKKEQINLTNFSIKNGDIVGICDNNSGKNSELSGVVLRVQRLHLEIAFENNSKYSLLQHGESYNLIKLTNDVTYRRLKAAVNDLYKCSDKTYLIDLLFKNEPILSPLSVLSPYSVYLPSNDNDMIWFNQNLNDIQKEAIKFSLFQKHLAVIQGPPGTGKTTTLTEIILQLICRGEKVFVFAPSNVAVDNIFKQLLVAEKKMSSRYKLNKNFSFIRLGHAARIDSEIQAYSLDATITNSDLSVVSDLRAELDQIKNDSRVPRGKFKEIRNEIGQYETKAFTETLKGADVIMSTLVSGHLNGQLKYLRENDPMFMFDNVIIDECAQALEAETWIPLAHAKKAILAGDHQQLAATIISQEAAKQGLSISLMERVAELFKSCDDKVFRLLTVQYRMNKLIMDWSSTNFYDNKLIAFEGVADRQLDGLPGAAEPLPVIRLIDTTGCAMFELEDSLSKGNRQEADIVCLYVRSLLDDYGISPSDIGVISPYRLQISLIESRCRQEFPDSICSNLEIQSVDGFQGREKEVIILSLVRSNQLGEIGFLIEQRRLNVAITRARSHLVVVCDSETVSKGSTVLESFIDYCYENADIVNAQDYLPELEKFDDIKIDIKSKSKSTNDRQKDNNKSSGDNNNKNRGNKNKSTGNYSHQNSGSGNGAKLNPQKVKSQLQQFIRDSSLMEFKFPATLTSTERRMVHEQCDKFGLVHQSVGGESNRRIVVKKNTKK